MSKAVFDKVDRFVAIHLGLLTLSAAIFWAFHYFTPGADLVSLISWHASDKPWVAFGSAQPLLGVHYFGDLQTLRSLGFVWNPYDDSLGLPSAMLPTGQLVMILMSVIPIDILLIFPSHPRDIKSCRVNLVVSDVLPWYSNFHGS